MLVNEVDFRLDTLDNEWLGHGYQERISSLEKAIEQLQKSDLNNQSVSNENPKIIITRAPPADHRSVQLAQEEYEQFRQTLEQYLID